MSFSRVIQWYHSHVEPIWPERAKKKVPGHDGDHGNVGASNEEEENGRHHLIFPNKRCTKSFFSRTHVLKKEY
jgi:hypothetical protein